MFQSGYLPNMTTSNTRVQQMPMPHDFSDSARDQRANASPNPHTTHHASLHSSPPVKRSKNLSGYAILPLPEDGNFGETERLDHDACAGCCEALASARKQGMRVLTHNLAYRLSVSRGEHTK